MEEEELEFENRVQITRALLKYFQQEGAVAILKKFPRDYFMVVFSATADEMHGINDTPFEEDLLFMMEDALEHFTAMGLGDEYLQLPD